MRTTDFKLLTQIWLEAMAAGELEHRQSAFVQFESWLADVSLDPAALTADGYSMFISSMVDAGFARETINRTDAHVRTLYRWSVKRKLLGSMPMADKPMFPSNRQSSSLSRDEIEGVIDALLQLCQTEGRSVHWNALDARRALTITMQFYWGLRPQYMVGIRKGLLDFDPQILGTLGIRLLDDSDPATRRFLACVSEYRHWLEAHGKQIPPDYAFFRLRAGEPTSIGPHALSQDLRRGALAVGFSRYESFTSQQLLRAHFDVFRADDAVAYAEVERSTLEDRIPTNVPAEMVIELLKFHPRHGLGSE